MVLIHDVWIYVCLSHLKMEQIEMISFSDLQAVPSIKGQSTLTPTAAACRKRGTTSCPNISICARPQSWCNSPTPASIMAPPTSRVTDDLPWRREKPTTTGDLTSVSPHQTPSWVGLNRRTFLNVIRFHLYSGLIYLPLSLRHIWESSMEAA